MLLPLLALAFLVPATATCLYFLVLTTVGRRRHRAPSPYPRHHIVVLIPAHDEELSLAAALDSIRATNYPRELRAVVVVADNCTDGTAAVAREHGATVVTRRDAVNRGKGYALQLGLRHALAARPDAVLVLDADCLVTGNVFRVLDAHLAAGAEAVQCAVVTRNADDGVSGFVGATGNAFDNLLAAGKDRLGRAVPLRGSGMCFTRDVLERFPWAEFGLTEDADYADRLRCGGVRVRFEGEPLVRSETPARRGDLYQQRRRWRAALFGGPGFLWQWVDSKPLVLAQLLATGAAVALAGTTPLAVWYGALLLMTVLTYLRVVAGVGLSRRRVGFLFGAPWVVARLAAVTVGGFGRRDQTWQRTRRAAEATARDRAVLPPFPS